MNLIERVEEQKTLERCLNSNKAEFVVLYGRRRVGKTYLIKEFFNQSFSFYASGVNNENNKLQLKNFSNALKEYGLTNVGELKDWLDAFEMLKALLEKEDVYRDNKSKKRIVFLDELPWMDGKNSDFKAALDLFGTHMPRQKEI